MILRPILMVRTGLEPATYSLCIYILIRGVYSNVGEGCYNGSGVEIAQRHYM